MVDKRLILTCQMYGSIEYTLIKTNIDKKKKYIYIRLKKQKSLTGTVSVVRRPRVSVGRPYRRRGGG